MPRFQGGDQRRNAAQGFAGLEAGGAGDHDTAILRREIVFDIAGRR